MFTSCVKESNLYYNADTVKVALVYRPDQFSGKDAIIQSFLPDSNFANIDYLAAFAWTNGGNFNTARILIKFDFSEIPIQTQIDSAKLSLFWVSHDLLPGQTGDNSFTIYKITESWQENSVTWNNQPSISNENLVFVPKSNSSSQSYREINITAFVQRMIVNPSENHGFMLWLDEELPYKSIVIASSDHPDQTKHPKLVVYY